MSSGRRVHEDIFLLRAAAVNREPLILTSSDVTVPQHPLDTWADLVPDAGPRLAGRPTERLGVLADAQEVAPPIIVDLEELRPSPDRHRGGRFVRRTSE